mgnify:FL=1
MSSNSKKRRDIEIYEKYWKFTSAYTDFNGEKFLKTLKLITKNISDRKNTNIIPGDGEYDKLQKELQSNLNIQMPSVRKAINTIVKLGFINSGLSKQHRLVNDYLRAPTIRYRQLLFSKIVTESANFSASSTISDNRRQIDFLTNTLMRIGKLTKKQLIGIITVDPDKYKEGFINLDELNKISFEINNIDFIERKYNQIGHTLNVLSKLKNLTFYNQDLYFEEDAKIKFQNDEDNKLINRNSYLDRLSKEILEKENFDKTGSKNKCMVNNIIYPNLISSHIKRSEKCNLDEKYDDKNLLLLSDEIDGPFDKGDISFTNDGKIIFANNAGLEFKNKFISKKLNNTFLDKERIKYLEWNRENWFNKSPNRHL